MPTVAAQVVARVASEGAEETERKLESVGRKSEETKEHFKHLKDMLSFAGGQLLFQGVSDAFGFLKDQMADTVKVAIDHEQIMAQTDAVLKSVAVNYEHTTKAVAAHYVTVGLSTKAHEALQKQLDAANYSLLIATDRWDAAKTHSKASADAFQHVKDKVAELKAALGQTSTVLVGGSGSLVPAVQITKQEIVDLAEKFSQVTTYSADTVQGGENLLLTFTNIGKDVFPQATQAILDVSQAMGQDLKSSAIQVGKALGDPVTGMTALQRIGVTFSKDEKDQIKQAMAHNDIMAAQKVILKELSTEFGGSATAAGKTFGGQMAILGNQFEGIKEKIGGALLPILGDLLTKYVVPLADKFADWLTKGGGLQDFQSIIQQISTFFTTDFLPNLDKFLNTFLIPLAGEIYDIFIKSGFLKDTWNDVSSVLQTMLPFLEGTVLNIGHFVEFLQTGNPLAETLKGILLAIGGAVLGIKIKDLISDFQTFVTDQLNNLPKIVEKLTGIKQAANDAKDAETAIGTTAKTTMAQDVATGAGEADASIAGIGVTSTGTEGVVGTAATGMKGMLAGVAGILSEIIGVLPIAIGAAIAGQQLLSAVGINNASVEGWNAKGTAQDITGFHLPGIGNVSQWLQMLNGIHFPGIPGFASGGANIPAGRYLVGEKGPELMDVPQGANIIPNDLLGGSGSGDGQPVYLQIDGYTFARLVLPYQVDFLRTTLGVRA